MKFNGIDYKQCNNRKQSKSRKKYGKYVVLLPCVFPSRCRQCFQLLTFDIGYGDVGYPVVLQVSMQDTVCACCGGWGVWRTKTQEKSFWRILSISSFSNTSSLSVLSELLQTFYRASAFEESPYVHTDNGFHLQLPAD